MLKSFPRNKVIALAVLIAICFCMSLYRCYISNTRFFFFLNWNLFLALVPFIISTYVYHSNITNKILLCSLGIIWILFLPNAPYLLTDLVHIKARKIIPIYYDVIMLFTFSWVGLQLFFMSLLHYEKIMENYITKWKIKSSLIVIFMFCGFGIYLGREIRCNSWDALHHPFILTNNIIEEVLKPSALNVATAMTIGIGLVLNVMYVSMKNLSFK
jgi:uncharacterized membrane protein